MNKYDILLAIKNAKKAHNQWIENANFLIEGGLIDESFAPVSAAECQFGIWYYTMGQAFKHLFSFRGIEKKHIALHQTYQEIFEMMAAQANKPVSFMGRLFETSSRNVGMSDEYKHLLKEKAKELEQLSYSVIKNLNELESIILIMSDEQIATTIGTISSLNAESTKNNGALHNKKVIIPGELHKQLKGLLHQYIGPITNIFYEQTKQKYLKDNTNEDLDDFIVQLIVEIPEAKQSEFQRQVQEILRKYKVNF